MKQKSNNKKMIVIITVVLIILISIYLFIQKNNFAIQEDLIFFKLINSRKENQEKVNKKDNEYELKVIQGNTNFHIINLKQTIDYKTLVNEKIAPGTKGYFNVILTSNETLQYELFIKNKNKAPKNLEFYIQEKTGTIKKNEIKTIQVIWKWKYEISEEKDIEDTKDGENLEKYNFVIGVIGELN